MTELEQRLAHANHFAVVEVFAQLETTGPDHDHRGPMMEVADLLTLLKRMAAMDPIRPAVRQGERTIEKRQLDAADENGADGDEGDGFVSAVEPRVHDGALVPAVQPRDALHGYRVDVPHVARDVR